MSNVGCEILAVSYMSEKRIRVVTRQGSFTLQAFGTNEIMVRDLADRMQVRLATSKDRPEEFTVGARIGMKP